MEKAQKPCNSHYPGSIYFLTIMSTQNKIRSKDSICLNLDSFENVYRISGTEFVTLTMKSITHEKIISDLNIAILRYH
jgi:hypothetical protein